MPELIDKTTGEPVHVPDGMVDKALKSGRYDVPVSGAEVATVDRISRRVVPTKLERGKDLYGELSIADPSQTVGSARERILEEEYGGVGGVVTTGIENLAQGASLGTYGLFNRATGLVDPADMRRRAEANPTTAVSSDILGGAIPALATGGGAAAAKGAAGLARGGAGAAVLRATPAGAAAGLGEALAARGAAAGGAAEFAGAALGYGAEGALVGAGEGLKELYVRSDEPVTVERAVSVLSSNALYGGVGGAAAGIVTRGVERGLDSARVAVDDYAAKLASPTVADEDLRHLDHKGLVREGQREDARIAGERATARRQLDTEEKVERVRFDEEKVQLRKQNQIDRADEVKRLELEQKQQQKQLGDEIAQHSKTSQKSKYWLATENKQLQARGWKKSDKKLRDLSEEIKTLRENPKYALGALRREEQTLMDIIDEGNAWKATLEPGAKTGRRGGFLARSEALLKQNRILQGRMEEVYRPIGSPKLNELELAKDAIGDMESEKLLAIRAAKDTLAATPAESPRLLAIKAAKEAAGTGGGIGEQIVRGGVFSAVAGAISTVPIPGAHLFGAIAGAKASQVASDFVFRRLGRASAETTARVARAVAAVTDTGKKAARVAPIAASRALTSVSYGKAAEPQPKRKERKGDKLLNGFRARAAEILAQTTAGPDGRMVMQQQARQAVAERLAPVSMVDPLLADRMETIAARRITFLAEKLPKRSDVGFPLFGIDRWQPSSFEMAKFARYVAAVEDPAGVVERVADGSLTPEDAEALREVYPEMYAEARNDLIRQIPAIQQTLPYHRQIALSIFFDVPVHPSMQPAVLGVLQDNFVEEPGTESGTAAPMPAPQFGSVKSSPFTPAQERAG